MLERYFVKPATVDRIRTNWLAPQIERYIGMDGFGGLRHRECLQTSTDVVSVLRVRPAAWREFSVGVRKSEAVAHGYPIMPVRHPPRSGWLDELGRLKGGWS